MTILKFSIAPHVPRLIPTLTLVDTHNFSCINLQITCQKVHLFTEKMPLCQEIMQLHCCLQIIRFCGTNQSEQSVYMNHRHQHWLQVVLNHAEDISRNRSTRCHKCTTWYIYEIWCFPPRINFDVSENLTSYIFHLYRYIWLKIFTKLISGTPYLMSNP